MGGLNSKCSFMHCLSQLSNVINFKVKLQEIDEKHFSGNFVAFCHNSKIYRSMQEFDEDIRILSFYYFF